MLKQETDLQRLCQPDKRIEYESLVPAKQTLVDSGKRVLASDFLEVVERLKEHYPEHNTPQLAQLIYSQVPTGCKMSHDGVRMSMGGAVQTVLMDVHAAALVLLHHAETGAKKMTKKKKEPRIKLEDIIPEEPVKPEPYITSNFPKFAYRALVDRLVEQYGFKDVYAVAAAAQRRGLCRSDSFNRAYRIERGCSLANYSNAVLMLAAMKLNGTTPSPSEVDFTSLKTVAPYDMHDNHMPGQLVQRDGLAVIVDRLTPSRVLLQYENGDRCEAPDNARRPFRENDDPDYAAFLNYIAR